MKTQIPNSIKSIKEAETFLTNLMANGEEYHPEDDAHDIIWNGIEQPTHEEKDKLNKCMSDIYDLSGFDPCGFILDAQSEKV